MVSGIRFLGFAILLSILRPAIAQEVVDVVMVTSEGTIEIALYADKAPVTVSNFLRYVDGELLDGGSFYRVVTEANDNGRPKIEVIQGGMGAGKKGFSPISHEATRATGILHTDGVISMARGALGTATSQFFICIGDQPGLDYGQSRNPDGQGFAAFGRVVKGMEIVRKIKELPVSSNSSSGYTKGQFLDDPVTIVSVSRK